MGAPFGDWRLGSLGDAGIADGPEGAELQGNTSRTSTLVPFLWIEGATPAVGAYAWVNRQRGFALR